MEITSSELRRCDLVTIKGRIDSATVNDLAKAFDDINAAARFKIVVNMKDVKFISSAGLGELVNTQKTCKRWNRGELVLAELPHTVKEVLDIAGLTPLFKVYDSETEAVGSF